MVTLVRPSPGAITSGFGQRTGGFHEGIDFGWGNGWNISAAAAGTVRHAGPGGIYGARYGNLTIIDHAGFQTRYAHQSRMYVRVGQEVAAGELIGVIGGSGAKGLNTYAPHLHFELLISGVKVNPGTDFTAPASGKVTPIEPDKKKDVTMHMARHPNGAITLIGEHTYQPLSFDQYNNNVKAYGDYIQYSDEGYRQQIIDVEFRRQTLLAGINGKSALTIDATAVADRVKSNLAADFDRLAGQIATINTELGVPTAEEIARAVNDDAAGRLAN